MNSLTTDVAVILGVNLDVSVLLPVVARELIRDEPVVSVEGKVLLLFPVVYDSVQGQLVMVTVSPGTVAVYVPPLVVKVVGLGQIVVTSEVTTVVVIPALLEAVAELIKAVVLKLLYALPETDSVTFLVGALVGSTSELIFGDEGTLEGCDEVNSSDEFILLPFVETELELISVDSIVPVSALEVLLVLFKFVLYVSDKLVVSLATEEILLLTSVLLGTVELVVKLLEGLSWDDTACELKVEVRASVDAGVEELMLEGLGLMVEM